MKIGFRALGVVVTPTKNAVTALEYEAMAPFSKRRECRAVSPPDTVEGQCLVDTKISKTKEESAALQRISLPSRGIIIELADR